MLHSSIKRFDSAKCPGVKFVLRKMTRRRVDDLDSLLSEPRARLRGIFAEFNLLDKERTEAVKTAEAEAAPERQRLISEGATKAEAEKSVPLKLDFPDEKFAKWAELYNQIQRIERQEIKPAVAQFCLARIEGLEVEYVKEDGTDATAPATVELISRYGPDELYDEIVAASEKECGLSQEESENLNSPSTSAALVDGKQGNAEPVEKPEMTLVSAA